MLCASAAGSARPPSATHFRRPTLSSPRRLLAPPARCPPAKPHLFAPENPRKFEIGPPQPRHSTERSTSSRTPQAKQRRLALFAPSLVTWRGRGVFLRVGARATIVQGPRAAAKPRLVLKFVWMEKNIGLGLDRTIPGRGVVPLGPYYFWPRKDAWEELKALLESKPWVSQKRMIILLNQATDIINLWQQSGADALRR